jgi:hypothetical protein
MEEVRMPTITISPLPPVQGTAATVCYDGDRPVTLDLAWTPDGAGPATLTIPKGGTGCVELIMPGNATSLSITDPTGGADEEATMISPG